MLMQSKTIGPWIANMKVLKTPFGKVKSNNMLTMRRLGGEHSDQVISM